VTGGAGFIGSHVVRALLAAGIAVRVLDNLSIGRAASLPPEAELVIGDLLDGEAVRRAVAGCDVVVHLAARVAIRSSFDHVAEDARTNGVGTAVVLDAAARSGTVRRVVFTSSMAVYAEAPPGVRMREDHATVPISPYGVSKLAGERLTELICARAGIGSVCLRLFNTYGRGQALTPYVGVVTIFVNALRAGERPIVFGDGEQARDFVHALDVARAFVLAATSPAVGTYNIGTGQAVTINAVLAAVQAAMGTAIEPDHRPAVAGEARFAVADVTAAAVGLGYVPGHRFVDRIAGVVDEILAAG